MTPAERLDELVRGANPREVTKLSSGYVVMHEWQFWPGYCLLLAYPQVENLNALTEEARAHFLKDMTSVGDAVLATTDAVRINYSIYGNVDPFLHAHIVPRYASEEFPTVPPMVVPTEVREVEAVRYSESHETLRRKIADALLAATD